MMNDKAILNSLAQMTKISALLLLSVLLIACDGGIFGTGGFDNTTVTAGTDGMEMGTTATDSGTTAGMGSNTAGDTGSGTGGTTTEGTSTGDSGGSVSFTNSTTTLAGVDAQLNVMNASARPVQIIDATETAQQQQIFDNSVPADTLSATAIIGSGDRRIEFIAAVDPLDSEAGIQKFSVAPLNVQPSTLTTLIVRDTNKAIDVVALATETQTSDATLAKLRVVQSDTLGNEAQTSSIRLQSAGTNPGGVDIVFDNVSFATPLGDYQEVPAGDYELLDAQNRFPKQLVSLDGGTVYTVLLHSAAEPVIIVFADSSNPPAIVDINSN